MKLQILNFLTILTSLLIASCTMHPYDTSPAPSSACEVSFAMQTGSDVEIRSSIGDDHCSVEWENGDCLALWAYDASGNPMLSAQNFIVYGKTATRAFFSSVLSNPMPDGVYTYWAASPSPLRVEGSDALFEIPTTQNGKGAGIMFSHKEMGGALKPVAEHSDTNRLNFTMRQRLHLLRFYVEDSYQLLAGEDVEAIELTLPAPVLGTLRQPIADLDAVSTLEESSQYLLLSLETPLSESSASERNYAYATIFPYQWGADDAISAKLYTETKVAYVSDVKLMSRNMQAGHATSVRLVPSKLRSYCRVYIHFNSNPIGERIQTITLTAPAGCKWGDNSLNVYSFNSSEGYLPGQSFLLEYEDEEAFRSLSGKSIQVTFDSEHIQTSQTVTIPNLSSANECTLSLDVPPLLEEDFSGVSTFSVGDNYTGGFNSGSKGPYSFLNGWSGGRIGGLEGVGVRLACRRETSARYPARMDSAPLNGYIKKPVDLKLTFDYGTGGHSSELFGLQLANVGFTCHMGYVTSDTEYASGASDGVFSQSFYVSSDDTATDGSYENLSKSASYVLPSVESGHSVVRISWRTVIDNLAGTHNTTDWLYLDNVKVVVSNEN